MSEKSQTDNLLGYIKTVEAANATMDHELYQASTKVEILESVVERLREERRKENDSNYQRSSRTPVSPGWAAPQQPLCE